MQVDIQARPFTLTKALKLAIAKVTGGLGRRYGDGVKKIKVRLSDVNGTRGGIDKRCLIVLERPRQKTVVAHALSPDMYQAIATAGRRAERALATRSRRHY